MSPIYINNKKIKSIYTNNQSIGKVYVGDELVFQKDVLSPFILPSTPPVDWRSPQNNYLWQGYITIPAGFIYNEVTNPVTGRTWMDRNLGASRVALSPNDSDSYGDLYQWGRDRDGHEKRNSPTTSLLNNGTYDAPNGVSVWRIPTASEWEAERLSWETNDAAGAFGSVLKLPAAGVRDYFNGLIVNVGLEGMYWSRSSLGTNMKSLYFKSNNCTTDVGWGRATGMSVRLIKDI